MKAQRFFARNFILMIMLIQGAPAFSQSCSGEVLCASSQQLVPFLDDSKSPKKVNIYAIGLSNSGSADKIMANAVRACLATTLSTLSCDKKCPTGCCDSAAKRICKTVLVRGQQLALTAGQMEVDSKFESNLVDGIDKHLPGKFKGKPDKKIGTGSLVYESGPTTFPCTKPGVISCTGIENLKNKNCDELKSLWEIRRDSWLKYFSEAVKSDPDSKDWNENPLRCGKGEGKFTISVSELVCGENGEVKSFPTVASKSECVEGAYNFAITARVQTVKTCDGCAVPRAKSADH